MIPSAPTRPGTWPFVWAAPFVQRLAADVPPLHLNDAIRNPGDAHAAQLPGGAAGLDGRAERFRGVVILRRLSLRP